MTLGPQAWAYAVLALVLVTGAVTDVRSGKIANWLTYPAALIALAGHALAGGWTGDGGLFGGGEGDPSPIGLAGSLLGLATGFVPLLVAWKAGGIGGGDAKIMGVVGALTGWRFALAAMFYGFCVAAIMAVAVLLYRRRLGDTMGRIGRFVVLVLLRNNPGDPATPESPVLPFGLALCIGSAIALGLTLAYGADNRMFLLGI